MSEITIPSRCEAEERIRCFLPPREQESHKGTHGNALLCCGSPRYTGAAMLSAMGALRAGAGITHLLSAEAALLPVRIRLPEVVCHPVPGVTESPRVLATADRIASPRGAILIGCGIGLGNGSETAAFCEALAALLAVAGAPVVLDADALNMLSADPRGAAHVLAAARRPVVLTPHPTEFSRLTGLPVSDIQADRTGKASAFAKAAGVTLLLKGHGTVIATADGHCTVNPSGTPALAKGGSGDVLAGVLVSLLACGMPAPEAAFAAAYLHGAAGERLATRDSLYGLLPSELPGAIAGELCRLTSNAS